MTRITLAATLLLSTTAAALAAPISGFTETPLVTHAGDPDLSAPWGIAYTPASPFWVADNGSSLSTLYNSSGVKQGLVVNIANAPTGVAFNPGASGGAFNGDTFLFASLSGNLYGWRGALSTNAEALSLGAGDSYTGLAAGTLSGNTYAYAANIATGAITTFKGTAAAPNLLGNFTDPNLPAGYAPYNVELLNGLLYVTYVPTDLSHNPIAGAGNGIIDVFDLNGVLQSRLVTGGALNNPWGLAFAPGTWGALSGALLVGNAGDGTIVAYTSGGALLGTLADGTGTALTNAGLRGLIFGNGGNGGSANSLYITANVNGGLLARIDAPSITAPSVPEPSTFGLASLALGAIAFRLRRTRK